MKQKILLHACCAPCTVGVWGQLKDDFEITLFWYNPNISPKAEHDRRLTELLNFCDSQNIKIIVGDYDWDEEHKYWLSLIVGLENEPERGKRCEVCYKMRLEATAAIAAQSNDHHDGEFDLFGAELSISPHKDVKMINEVGERVGRKIDASRSRERGNLLRYYIADFKKREGGKKSAKISREYKMYRQNFCGCEFSDQKIKITPQKY